MRARRPRRLIRAARQHFRPASAKTAVERKSQICCTCVSPRCGFGRYAHRGWRVVFFPTLGWGYGHRAHGRLGRGWPGLNRAGRGLPRIERGDCVEREVGDRRRARCRRARAPRHPAGSSRSGSRSCACRRPSRSGCPSASPRPQRSARPERPAGARPRDTRPGPACPRDLLRRDRGPEEPRQPGQLEGGIDQRAVGRRREAERPARREPLDSRSRPRDQRQLLVVARLHQLHDVGADLLGRSGHAECPRQISRPLGRAHPHHRPLRLLVVASPAARRRSGRAPRPRPPRSAG